jgi:hypothetical protein
MPFSYIQDKQTVNIQSFFCQQMHSLLKHKMLQLTLKISLYMAATCFGPFGPSSESMRRNIVNVTIFVQIINKNTSLKLCCAVAICASVCVYWVVCGMCFNKDSICWQKKSFELIKMHGKTTIKKLLIFCCQTKQQCCSYQFIYYSGYMFR